MWRSLLAVICQTRDKLMPERSGHCSPSFPLTYSQCGLRIICRGSGVLTFTSIAMCMLRALSRCMQK